MSNLSFQNTELAFVHKTNKELKGARFLFKSMGVSWLVKIGTRLTPWAIKIGLPISGIIKKTIFKQFVGGETLQETIPVCKNLSNYKVQVILDYGVEGGEANDNAFNHSCEEFIKVISFASTQNNIPFISIKVTGFAAFSLLEKIDTEMHLQTSTLIQNYQTVINNLSQIEKAAWDKVVVRLEKICKAAVENKIAVLVDAEETWIQDPVDALTILMMDKYNKENIFIFNTIQLYRHDRLQFLKDNVTAAKERGFILAVKLVRGAYMEKERKRAEEQNYNSPIQPTKEKCDSDYNEALQLCMDNILNMAFIVASHNESSNLLATQLLTQKGLPTNHPHIHFSQLYGMSDNISFNLANAGYNASKYLPFGPITDVIPYLMRRAQENSSVAGQTGRELHLIKEELNRRVVS